MGKEAIESVRVCVMEKRAKRKEEKGRRDTKRQNNPLLPSPLPSFLLVPHGWLTFLFASVLLDVYGLPLLSCSVQPSIHGLVLLLVLHSVGCSLHQAQHRPRDMDYTMPLNVNFILSCTRGLSSWHIRRGQHFKQLF